MPTALAQSVALLLSAFSGCCNFWKCLKISLLISPVVSEAVDGSSGGAISEERFGVAIRGRPADGQSVHQGRWMKVTVSGR